LLEVVLYALLVVVIFGSCCGVLEMVVVFVGGNCGVLEVVAVFVGGGCDVCWS
jgi:hypothetical protein